MHIPGGGVSSAAGVGGGAGTGGASLVGVDGATSMTGGEAGSSASDMTRPQKEGWQNVTQPRSVCQFDGKKEEISNKATGWDRMAQGAIAGLRGEIVMRGACDKGCFGLESSSHVCATLEQLEKTGRYSRLGGKAGYMYQGDGERHYSL